VITELRLRSYVNDATIGNQLKGRVLGSADYDVLLTGPTRVRKPNGQALAVYLPGVLAEHAKDEQVYDVLHSLRNKLTKNRGAASGTQRLRGGSTRRSYARETPSAVIGAMGELGQTRYCRLTAWTGANLPSWQSLQPMLRTIADNLGRYVPDRYAAQLGRAQASDPAWVVPGTPFSTVTVNNSYPTGVHKDQGDLPEGFSTIGVLRRGQYTGGQLVFPAWRVAVDMHDGDLLLMDAHDWHGNVPLVCACGRRLVGPCGDCGAERISVVSYFRTNITECGSPADELVKAESLPKYGGVIDGAAREGTSANETAAAAR